MKVKVCGLTPRTDFTALSELAIDFGGLIFVVSSPRYCGREPFTLPSSLKPVGVFKNQSLEEVTETAKRWNLHAVQLHGDESPAYCRALSQSQLVVWKALGITSALDFTLSDKYRGCIDTFVFDTPGGGTGQKFDWSLLDHYQGQTPFFLAGGLGAEDRSSIGSISHPAFKGVDLNSRFEDGPGKKNISLLKSFLDS